MGNNISVFGNRCPPVFLLGKTKKKTNKNNNNLPIYNNFPPFIITPFIDVSYNNL
jgi:hypothetical protein